MSTHRTLIPSIAGGNGELVLEFFATFSRFEYALKRAHFVNSDRNHNVLPAWEKFADKLNGRIAAITNKDFVEARSYLLGKPPRKQVLTEPGKSTDWEWKPNSRRSTDSEERYLLRLVCDVRNNLFHGGKYPGDSVDGTERNRDLLQACLTILYECLPLDVGVKRFFEEDS